MAILDRLLDLTTRTAAQLTAQLTSSGGLLAWAATYLLHSTLLLGAAWAVSHVLRGRSLRLEERLWKAALVGALLTATVQTGVAALAPPSAAPVASVAVRSDTRPVAPTSLATPSVPRTATDLRAANAPVTPDPRLSRLSALLPGWQKLALGAWALGALFLAASLAVRWGRLRARLRRREDVAAGTPRRLLDRLLEATSTRRRVRLTGSTALPVPVALGVGEREICLPHRALSDLDDRHQEGLLAHELAHLERRDPAWLLLALGIESLLFFQPLNRFARRRLEEIAELQCDAWAVRVTGDRVGLARCLTEVASWLLEGRRSLSSVTAPGTAAMARGRGQLGVRVRRILADDAAAEGGDLAAGRRWLPTAAAAGLLALVLVVPGLAPSSLASEGPGQDPEAGSAVAPGADGVRSDERAVELRSHREADAGLQAEAEAGEAGRHGEREEWEGVDEWADEQDIEDIEDGEDGDHDWDTDWDWDFDFEGMVDPDEIAEIVAEAMEAAHAGMLDESELADLQHEIDDAMAEAAEAAEAMEGMPGMLEAQREALAELERGMPALLAEAEREMAHEKGRALTAEERERMQREIEREMAGARQEMRRGMEEARREMEEARPRMEELRRQVSGEMRQQLEDAHREMEHAREEMARARIEAREEMSEEDRAAREEARAGRQEALREAEREIGEARRELEQTRRELDREREELERERRVLEQERRRLGESEEEPPGS